MWVVEDKDHMRSTCIRNSTTLTRDTMRGGCNNIPDADQMLQHTDSCTTTSSRDPMATPICETTGLIRKKSSTTVTPRAKRKRPTLCMHTMTRISGRNQNMLGTSTNFACIFALTIINEFVRMTTMLALEPMGIVIDDVSHFFSMAVLTTFRLVVDTC